MTTTKFNSIDELIRAQASVEGRAPRAEDLLATKIQYVIGDATQPLDVGTSERFIVHVCNDVGAWGAGFTRALSRLSPKPEQSYRNMIRATRPNCLGSASIVKVDGEAGIFCANMIAQQGLPSRERRVVIDYPALEQCLGVVGKIAYDWGASAHMPRIGCGLAGGDWPTVERLIEQTLCARGIPVVVYDLPKNPSAN